MTPELAVSKLVQAGAAMTPALGAVPIPVGLMRRLEQRRWFW